MQAISNRTAPDPEKRTYASRRLPGPVDRMDKNLMTPERLSQGYVIVLPGIEGRSFLNRSIVRGLVAANVPYAIEIHDWTYGPLGYFCNLRDKRRHRSQADEIAGKIVRYRETHPRQPVYLVGHSGGGAMTLFTLERLPVTTSAPMV